eukprot:NODE_315_length_11202_cov_0.258849.p6 type:complete len:219 gc:universal NODE_315_length_11202_cov_0.258849:5074-4418(-)
MLMAINMYWLNFMHHGAVLLANIGHCKKLAPEYELVASAFANEEDIVLAKINAEDETITAGKYGITGFPTLKFFPKGDKEPQTFDGKRNEAGIIAYLNKVTGSDRQVGGKLGPTQGTIVLMNNLVEEFSKSKDKKSVIKKTKEAAEMIGTRYAKYYYQVMDRVVNDSKFIGTELNRLGRVLSGDLTPAKKDDFYIRRNILRVFKGPEIDVKAPGEDEL